MKRIFLWLAVALGLAPAYFPKSRAGSAEAAAAIAARQDADDRYQRLSASVQELQAANAGLQKKLSALIEELQKVREEAARNGANYATHEDLNRLAEKLREVDQKREADNRRILDALEKLAKTPLPGSDLRRMERTDLPENKSPKGPSSARRRRAIGTRFKREDKLSMIVQEYRKKGVKVTLQQVKDANPDVNPNRLLVGQKIWIPDASAIIIRRYRIVEIAAKNTRCQRRRLDRGFLIALHSTCVNRIYAAASPVFAWDVYSGNSGERRLHAGQIPDHQPPPGGSALLEFVFAGLPSMTFVTSPSIARAGANCGGTLCFRLSGFW
jgi:uncharacterized coiled-coil protein SlyX